MQVNASQYKSMRVSGQKERKFKTYSDLRLSSFMFDQGFKIRHSTTAQIKPKPCLKVTSPHTIISFAARALTFIVA